MGTEPNLLAKKLTIVRFGSLIGPLPAKPLSIAANGIASMGARVDCQAFRQPA